MELPIEIKDEIASNFIYFKPVISDQQVRRNANVWAMITSDRKTIVQIPKKGLVPAFETRFVNTKLDLAPLLALRLVSRSWSASATRILSRYNVWELGFDKDKLERIVGSTDDEDLENPILKSIAKINIPPLWHLRTFDRYHVLDRSGWNERLEGNWAAEYQTWPYTSELRHPHEGYCHNHGPTRGADLREHYDRSAEHSMMRRFFDNLTRVETFSVHFPEAESGDSQGYQHPVDCYDELGMYEMFDTIHYGLQSPAFNALISLTLAVPTTYDVKLLGDALDQDARDRLRHLRIVIVDASGPNGSTEYICEHGNWDGNKTSFLRSSYLPSNWHVQRPNRAYQEDMYDFIASCRGLESLSMQGTQYLDLDQFVPNFPVGLKVLCLERFWSEADSLIRLLTPVAKRVLFRDVKMRIGGEWAEVFNHAKANCPDLDWFYVYQLYYFHAHPSYGHNNRLSENCNMIWTESREDIMSLKELVLPLMDKAGGEASYPGAEDFYWDEIRNDIDEGNENHF